MRLRRCAPLAVSRLASALAPRRRLSRPRLPAPPASAVSLSLSLSRGLGVSHCRPSFLSPQRRLPPGLLVAGRRCPHIGRRLATAPETGLVAAAPTPVAAAPETTPTADCPTSSVHQCKSARKEPELRQRQRQMEQDVETVIKVLQPGPIGIVEHKFTDAEIHEAQATVRRAVENWQRNWTLERNLGGGSFDKWK